MPETLSASQARRIVLAAQGLADSRPAGAPTGRRLRSLIERLGAVQIDSVNVLARTHYLPAFSRLGAYPRDMLENAAWGRKPSLFEYWGHEASLMPVAMQPLFRWRMERRGPARHGADWPGSAARGGTISIRSWPASSGRDRSPAAISPTGLGRPAGGAGPAARRPWSGCSGPASSPPRPAKGSSGSMT